MFVNSVLMIVLCIICVVRTNQDGYEFLYIRIPQRIKRVPEALDYVKNQSSIMRRFFEAGDFENKTRETDVTTTKATAKSSNKNEKINNVNPDQENGGALSLEALFGCSGTSDCFSGFVCKEGLCKSCDNDDECDVKNSEICIPGKQKFSVGYGFSGVLGSVKPSYMFDAVNQAEKKMNEALNQKGRRRKYWQQIKVVLDFVRGNYGEGNRRCLQQQQQPESSSDAAPIILSGFRSANQLKNNSRMNNTDEIEQDPLNPDFVFSCNDDDKPCYDGFLCKGGVCQTCASDEECNEYDPKEKNDGQRLRFKCASLIGEESGLNEQEDEVEEAQALQRVYRRLEKDQDEEKKKFSKLVKYLTKTYGSKGKRCVVANG